MELTCLFYLPTHSVQSCRPSGIDTGLTACKISVYFERHIWHLIYAGRTSFPMAEEERWDPESSEAYDLLLLLSEGSIFSARDIPPNCGWKIQGKLRPMHFLMGRLHLAGGFAALAFLTPWLSKQAKLACTGLRYSVYSSLRKFVCHQTHPLRDYVIETDRPKDQTSQAIWQNQKNNLLQG